MNNINYNLGKNSDVCCISIPIECFNSSNPQCLNDIDLSKECGRNMWRIIQFISIALHNIKMGSNDGSYYFDEVNKDKSNDNSTNKTKKLSKFVTILEPLIRTPLGTEHIDQNLNNDDEIDRFYKHVIGKKILEDTPEIERYRSLISSAA